MNGVSLRTGAASFKRVLGRAPRTLSPRFENLTQGVVYCGGIFELRRDIWLEDDDIGALAKALDVLAAHATTKVVFGAHLVTCLRDLAVLLHISVVLGAWPVER